MSYKTTLIFMSLILCLGVFETTQADENKLIPDSQNQIAIFAGGCFWCVESDFDKVPGVIETTSGFDGGRVTNPTYEQVSAGGTGYAESVRITYDPAKVSYQQLLDYFWHHIDPTTANAQFCDHGTQYRTAIFYLNEEQHQLAVQSKAVLEKNKPFKGPIMTQIVASTEFYPAEPYHQNFHETHTLKYKFYRYSCGRDQRVKELWGNSD